MILWNLLSEVEIEETDISDFSIDISAVCCDSRKVVPGSVFVCMSGVRSDGHDFIGDAVEGGAAVVVTGESASLARFESCVTGRRFKYIRVKNTREAYARMWYNLSFPDDPPKLKIAALTGTNGKTTTAYLLREMLAGAGYETALLGTISGTLTTPDPDELYPYLKKLDGKYDWLVMEASSHALALDKLAPLRFELAAFTNLTPEHLDFHGTMESYFAAKSKLFGMCRAAVINFDDQYGQQLLGQSLECVTARSYSAFSDEAYYTAHNIQLKNTDGVSFELVTKGSIYRITSQMPGMFAVYNLLCAASCADVLGIGRDGIAKAAAELKSVPGRLQKVDCGTNFSVYIDFAHTPDALFKLLRCARSFTTDKGRLTVLFGCGGDRDRQKRPEMGKVASSCADFTIITSDNSRSEEPSEIIREIMKGVDKERPHIVIENRRDAIRYAVGTARKGDVIILAGKGHESYELDRFGKHPFSEEQIVLDAVREIM